MAKKVYSELLNLGRNSNWKQIVDDGFQWPGLSKDKVTLEFIKSAKVAGIKVVNDEIKLKVGGDVAKGKNVFRALLNKLAASDMFKKAHVGSTYSGQAKDLVADFTAFKTQIDGASIPENSSGLSAKDYAKIEAETSAYAKLYTKAINNIDVIFNNATKEIKNAIKIAKASLGKCTKVKGINSAGDLEEFMNVMIEQKESVFAEIEKICNHNYGTDGKRMVAKEENVPADDATKIKNILEGIEVAVAESKDGENTPENSSPEQLAAQQAILNTNAAAAAGKK